MAWTKLIPPTEITNGVTEAGVKFAEEFGTYLAKSGDMTTNGKVVQPLTTSQLRRFFGEVKRQQMNKEFNKTEFILLKPKLAYAVGRAREKGQSKITDFNTVIADAIDKVTDGKQFKNFVNIFEAIVAYHKAAGGK